MASSKSIISCMLVVLLAAAPGALAARQLQQAAVSLDTLIGGVQNGLKVVAPVVNGIASRMPILTPAIGGSCITGTKVALTKTDIYCYVATGADLTKAMFGATGAFTAFVPVVMNGGSLADALPVALSALTAGGTGASSAPRAADTAALGTLLSSGLSALTGTAPKPSTAAPVTSGAAAAGKALGSLVSSGLSALTGGAAPKAPTTTPTKSPTTTPIKAPTPVTTPAVAPRITPAEAAAKWGLAFGQALAGKTPSAPTTVTPVSKTAAIVTPAKSVVGAPSNTVKVPTTTAPKTVEAAASDLLASVLRAALSAAAAPARSG